MKLTGLNKKILFGTALLLMALGLAIAFTTQTIVFRVLKNQFKSNGISYARSIAANGLVDVLTMNTRRLKNLAENERMLKPDIAYIFIIDSSGNVLAHTFHKGFPKDLIKANSLSGHSDFNVQPIDTGMGIVYDIAAPIILDKSIIGQVRLGMKQNGIQKTIRLINLVIMALTLAIILIGIIIAYKFSALITKPISQLVKGIQSVQKGDFSAKIHIANNDEVGLLAGAFNEMTLRLHSLVEEIRALTKFKERERIALDLHDGIAQNLVSIIKRVELCEKLVKADPEEALQELKVLKFKTKDILNETRQVIFDIKSYEEEHCGMLERLRLYVKDYESINDIAVKITTADLPDNISAEKCSSIFYIITEALNNAGKHSFAKNVTLDIAQDNGILKILIEDDGRGFDVKAEKASGSQRGKYGLAGMYQRAEDLGGKLSIHSAVNKGSVIGLEIPLV